MAGFLKKGLTEAGYSVDTTASGVQSAIALEALVSAAFILINSKVGDLIGRKRAYVIGLCAYAVGALAMTLAQSVTAIIIFWAIIGGLGASLLLPAMQSLIHGNFTGDAQKRAYAMVGAAAAVAAAVGPLLGGFVTTYLSWRVGFALEVVGVGDRCAEHADDPIAQKLVDGALVVVEHLGHGGEVAVEHLGDVGRCHLRGERGETPQIAKQHRQISALSF